MNKNKAVIETVLKTANEFANKKSVARTYLPNEYDEYFVNNEKLSESRFIGQLQAYCIKVAARQSIGMGSDTKVTFDRWYANTEKGVWSDLAKKGMYSSPDARMKFNLVVKRTATAVADYEEDSEILQNYKEFFINGKQVSYDKFIDAISDYATYMQKHNGEGYYEREKDEEEEFNEFMEGAVIDFINDGKLEYKKKILTGTPR